MGRNWLDRLRDAEPRRDDPPPDGAPTLLERIRLSEQGFSEREALRLAFERWRRMTGRMNEGEGE